MSNRIFDIQLINDKGGKCDERWSGPYDANTAYFLVMDWNEKYEKCGDPKRWEVREIK